MFDVEERLQGLGNIDDRLEAYAAAADFVLLRRFDDAIRAAGYRS